jgi:two-component system, response regulator PdtaR
VTAKQKIMIVDDEVLVRLVGSELLGDFGYEVIEAENAAEALSLLETCEEVELLFTDIRMPGDLDGLKLAQIVNERWPDIKLLITSGDTWPPANAIPDDGHFLPKPYHHDDLRREVELLLQDSEPGARA